MGKDLTGNILIVDDHDMSGLGRNLEHHGHRARCITDPLLALDRIGRERFDLILLDVMMPGMNGLACLAEIRRRHSMAELPVILVTGADLSDDVVAGLSADANDYVAKPVDLAVVLARIQTQLKLRQLTKLKDDCLTIASHDIKGPLSVILGATGLLRRLKPGQVVTPKHEALVASVEKHARTIRSIINDFLDFQSLAGGALRVRQEVLDATAVVREVTESHRERATARGIALELDLPAEPVHIRSDRARVEQITENLISNAVKCCSANDRITVRLRAADGMQLIEVADSGPGIPEDQAHKVFAKFAQIDGQRPAAGVQSSGLGLYICKHLVELLQGEIGFRNNPSRGVTFWFTLPSEPGEAAMCL